MTRPPPGPNRGSADHEPGGEAHRSELREFLAQVAVSLVLEGSTPPNAEPPPPAPRPAPARAGRAGRRSTPLAAFLLVVAVVLSVLRWWPEPVTLPETLQGYWTTSDPAFSGRALLVERASLGFRVGGDQPVQVFPVRHRLLRSHGAVQEVRVDYEAPEGVFTITLSLSPDGLRLENRSEVLWTREAPGDG